MLNPGDLKQLSVHLLSWREWHAQTTWPEAGVLYQHTECYLESWCLPPYQPQTLRALNLDKLLVPTLVLGALLESEVKFPVLTGMLIMAMLSMGKDLNGGSFSSTLARSGGTRA